MRQLLLLTCLALGAMLLAGFAASSQARADGTARPLTQDAAPVSRAGRWLLDDQGRVVVMHGVNLVQKTPPYVASYITPQDARFLADEGFDAAREGMLWAGLEPAAGQYSAAYIDQLARLNDLLAQYGIRTLLDMHQDAWSSYAQPAIGDGAPAWADLAPTMLGDFQDFWDDRPGPGGRGLQEQFDTGWQRVAAALGTSANVFGYDPFNEPYAGSNWLLCPVFTPCPGFEAGQLANFYDGAITAIRRVDRRHVIFPEGIAQNGIEQPGLPAFGDSQTAFNFHFYCQLTESVSSPNPVESAGCPPTEQSGLGNFYAYAGRLGVPAVLSEFGASAPPDDLERIVEWAGQRFISWTQWAVDNDFANVNQPFTQANAQQSELNALVVPYPQAIAGTPGSWSFDYPTATMTFSYTAVPVPGARLTPGAPTRIFVPQRQYPTGYSVAVSGAKVISGPPAPWLELTAAAGARVTVTIKPAAGSYTLTPLQSAALPLPAPRRCPAPSRHPTRKAHRHKQGAPRCTVAEQW